ncbi:beta-lactamase family protein [Actinocorallia sp. API 0066]|uniref:serine hydrolase domain-containing protein n=1 Tax=Actinocorallia sp. API 0066 TaxID=2896846 RepID=UPI001E47CAB7|nr:serine hydrolase [Actinocorallia sp. API 0066]MCD0453509.1 beta-lactamase family protein [Actinocorallia sp. API 0066]
MRPVLSVFAALVLAGTLGAAPATASARDVTGPVLPYAVLPGFDALSASHRPVRLVSAPRPLDVTYTVDGKRHTLNDYLRRTAQGFVVLDGNRIVKEWYARGYSQRFLFQSWSMAKSLTSDAVGIALHEGRIKSLSDPVARYVPELDGSAYGDVSLFNLLRMSSGVAWSEVPDTVPQHVLSSLGARSTLRAAASARRGWEPGSRFNYNSLDTAVLSLVLQRATGQPFHAYVQRKIWGPAGMGGTAYLGNDSHGNGMGYCCLYATDRDFARFGKLMLDGGRVGGRQVVPASWVRAATTPSGVSPSYGLQWWIDPGHGFYASGAFDQKIYVSTRHHVVIVRSTLYNPADAETLPALRAVAAEVARTR